MKKKTTLFIALCLCVTTASAQVSPERVKAFNELRFGAFICWSFSSFSNIEWTYKVKSVDFFNPTGFEPEQWVSTVKAANMNYILLLTKHHDGFCLWDTKTTDRKVTKSSLKKDVVAAVRKACDKQGIKLALYFSEGDWSWENPKSPEIKKAQLKELLTNYGPIEYIWFDHAIGNGGLNHEETTRWVKSFQPNCMVGFNHGPAAGDLRLGEMGKPTDLNDLEGAGFNREHMKGYTGYQTAEFTYPILAGNKAGTPGYARWFYTMPEWDDVAISAEEIYEHYVNAVKYNNAFSLDLGPDRSGRIRDIDVSRLQQVGKYIRGEEQPKTK